ncbi:HoxN/HupN/NixA family nickel/cobalt transporter [Tumebacillus flagellatus]|uniref:Nickel/cobalt efflux system n=1 Tax=Tumebacillus flagellatus TaxID=1157490 RepID=A0A074M4F8_9BACL|nr:HoxN/HupN/NixA family nickel/cobalt transporter [Tumebacillus flagellatus]KEO80892.1 hypothetical protein EL26_23715 [Tumebacillus flagellatus]
MEKTPNDKRAWGPYAWAVFVIHLAGLLLLVLAMPGHPFFVGLGFLAYTMGMRHAFDVDHIVAIDNVVRKLLRDKQNPTGVGFTFSLGHSTVVFLLSVCAALFAKWMMRQLPQLAETGGMIGTLVSGSFLLLIGILNLFILIEIIKMFRAMKKNNSAESEDLERLLQARGFFFRFVSRWSGFIRKSWHVYPLGFLFGLGLDTAGEIAMLSLSQRPAGETVSLAGAFALPILFMAGMCLMDTADGVFMSRNYRWALDNPIRKVYYNLTVTALSVFAALGIGVMELAQVMIPTFQGADLGWMGYSLVALFAVAWGGSYLIWRLFRIEEQWSANRS